MQNEKKCCAEIIKKAIEKIERLKKRIEEIEK